MCTLSVSNVIYHTFSHGAAFYTVNGKNVNVMLECTIVNSVNTVSTTVRYGAYAKFRCGVAPLRIETGRYERLQLYERCCFHCANKIESENHALLECPLYDDFAVQVI